jgi:S1-C subfamily serine protease
VEIRPFIYALALVSLSLNVTGALAQTRLRTEPRPIGDLAASIDPRKNLVPRLGVLGVSWDPRIAAIPPMGRMHSGVVIVSTVPGAIDSRDGGLAPGDIVYGVNRTLVAGLDELRSAIDALKAGDAVVLQLERDGELMYLAFAIE